jgi:putative hydrolase of the HAD superfamily
MGSKFSAVAFDLDGTLYPNYRLNIRLLPFLCGHWPLIAALGRARKMIRQEQELSPSSVQPDFHVHQAELVAKLLHARPEKIKEKIDRLVYRNWGRYFSSIKLFPHVRETLACLRAEGLKLGLLSDFPPFLKLKNLGLDDWDIVLCSEDTGTIKPAPQSFRELSNALGCPPELILYVGNSRRYDVAGAGRAGMKTALRTHAFAGGTEADCMRRVLSTRVPLARKQIPYQNSNPWVADFTFHDYRQLRDFVLH